jgi:hypothetical protein
MNSPNKCPVEVFTVELGNQRGYVAHVRLSGSGKKIHETDPSHSPVSARLDGYEWAQREGRSVAN